MSKNLEAFSLFEAMQLVGELKRGCGISFPEEIQKLSEHSSLQCAPGQAMLEEGLDNLQWSLPASSIPWCCGSVKSVTHFKENNSIELQQVQMLINPQKFMQHKKKSGLYKVAQ